MSENERYEGPQQMDRTPRSDGANDNLNPARNVDNQTVSRAQAANRNIIRSMTDIPGIGKGSGSSFTITDGDSLLSSAKTKAPPLDNTPDAVARRDLEKLMPPGSHMRVDFQRTSRGLEYTVSGGTSDQNAQMQRAIDKQGDAFWERIDHAVGDDGRFVTDLGTKPQTHEQQAANPTDAKPATPQYKSETPRLDATPTPTTSDKPASPNKSPEDVVKDRLGQYLPEGTPVTVSMKHGLPWVSWRGEVSAQQQQDLQKALRDPEVARALNALAKSNPGFTFNAEHERPAHQSGDQHLQYKQGEYLQGGANHTDANLNANRTRLDASAQAQGADRANEQYFWTGRETVNLGGKSADVNIFPTDRSFENMGRVRAELGNQHGDISEVSGFMRKDASGKCNYYIDSYVDRGQVHRAPAGRYFASIPMNKSNRDGSFKY